MNDPLPHWMAPGGPVRVEGVEELVGEIHVDWPADAPGNHVVLTLADHRHVLYEHLRPGSVTVRPGDRVRKGQVLGALGFSGDSTGPHLHLHVCDEGVPNAGEGLPFVFERFERLGAYEDLATLGRARWSAAPAGDAMVRRDEKPGSNRVIRFTAS
ncbi:M23 family metallopeptidase [Mitsuaria sp. PDC51]|uniref:M23 family metallopeptidase n=1 Tax=Mitsuaria sp. PDC51 TaxID=1881035 RepID=UPI000AC169BB|nr:M23 family metallopeptidase [Mitsuaria sp. PDC51]